MLIGVAAEGVGHGAAIGREAVAAVPMLGGAPREQLGRLQAGQHAQALQVVEGEQHPAEGRGRALARARELPARRPVLDEHAEAARAVVDLQVARDEARAREAERVAARELRGDALRRMAAAQLGVAQPEARHAHRGRELRVGLEAGRGAEERGEAADERALLGHAQREQQRQVEVGGGKVEARGGGAVERDLGRRRRQLPLRDEGGER